MKTRKLFLFIALIGFLKTTSAQVVLYVTDDNLGNPGSLDIIIDQAVIEANNGESVTVFFDAPGLCKITDQLPPINITNGSIVFDKSINATTDQGLEYESTIDNYSIAFGLQIVNTTPQSSIEIKNLKFIDFIWDPFIFNRSSISIANSHNVFIHDCKFESNYYSVNLTRTVNFDFVDNIISSIQSFGVGVRIFDLLISSGLNYSSIIKANDISGDGNGIVIHRANNISMNHSAEIEENTISCGSGTNSSSIVVMNHISNPTVPSPVADPTFQVSITANEITNTGRACVEFYHPYKHFVVENNNLTSNNGRCVWIFSGSSYPNPYGIDFIESNTLGLSVKNTGNIFNSVWPSGNGLNFTLQGVCGDFPVIAGLNLSGSVAKLNTYSIIRENKIISHINRPIIESSNISSSYYVEPPVITSATLNGNNLSIDFNLPGAKHILGNTPFVVEFFKSNSHSDLVEYLGNYEISNALASGYSATATLPSPVNLGVGDIIATTITAYGNTLETGAIIGTSEASFFANLVVEEFDQPCEFCVPSFELEAKTYIISAWTKEEGAPPTKTSYNKPSIELEFTDGNISLGVFNFQPSGVIIDGWQRIEGEFEVPLNTIDIKLQLKTSSGDAYFDDIRIFPFDGSMKSYVYDPITMRLMAELDERNYATIYEYDEEGKLIRVKKETERGIMTIQENKTFIKKTKE